MESLNYTIDCWAFFGPVEWNIDSVYKYVHGVRRIYAMFGAKETHYGFCENPYGIIKGSHGGSAKNVLKKVDNIYSKGATLKSLEFFSLPKKWNFAYSDYGVYLCRGLDYIVLGYDTEMYHSISLEDILLELKAQLRPVWGEHFQITKGNQPLVYCMDRFEKNPHGENLIGDTYIQKLQPIHIVNQFKVKMED